MPYCCNSFAAVLAPMPGTPLTLSTLSPTRLWKSTTCSGVTPQSSIRAARSRYVFFRRLSIRTRSPISCRQSLSVVQMMTSIPFAAAAVAMVAMMSSASYPGTWRTGRFIACKTAWTIGTCIVRSGEGGSRWAL